MTTPTSKPTVKSRWPQSGWVISFPKTENDFATWFESSIHGVAAAIRVWRRDGCRGISARDRAGYPLWPRDLMQFNQPAIDSAFEQKFGHIRSRAK